MTFPTRWRLGVLTLTMFLVAALLLTGFHWLALALVLAVALLGFPQSYDLQESEVVLRAGVARRRVPFRKIVAIERILSPRRPDGEDAAICIRLEGGREVRLSPRDPLGFERALRERLPHLGASNSSANDPR